MPRSLVLLVLFSLGLVACSGETSTKRRDGADANPIGLVGPNGGRAPVWTTWTPQSDQRVTPTSWRRGAQAFDRVDIRDDRRVEDIWSSLSAVLGTLANSDGVTPVAASTLQVMLQLLEPSAQGGGRLQLELTFVTRVRAGQDAWEGILLRLHRTLPSGSVPALAVFVRRRLDKAIDPQQITVWAVTGFRQGAPVTVELNRGSAGVAMVAAEGIVAPSTTANAKAQEALALAMKILAKAVWKPFIGEGYVRQFESEEGAEASELPASSPESMPRSEGLKLQERSVEQISDRSVFPPRVDENPFR